MEQWNDPAFARSWAERNAEDSAERKQPLDLLQRIVSNHLASGSVPARVLDLGCGHGVIAARILHELPTVALVGVDSSPPMLELARERLAPFADRCVLAQADFETMIPADLPGGPFGVAVAVQSLHNSTDEGKKRALDAVRAELAHGGLFLLLDCVRLSTIR